jgi:hypothetical protein
LLQAVGLNFSTGGERRVVDRFEFFVVMAIRAPFIFEAA